MDACGVSLEVEPAQQGLQGRGGAVLGAAGVAGDAVDLGVASPAEDVRLCLRQEGQDALGAFRLVLRADQADGGLVEAPARGLSMDAEPGAHQKLKDRVPHVGKADGTDAPELVLREVRLEIVLFHGSVPFRDLVIRSPFRKAGGSVSAPSGAAKQKKPWNCKSSTASILVRVAGFEPAWERPRMAY